MESVEPLDFQQIDSPQVLDRNYGTLWTLERFRFLGWLSSDFLPFQDPGKTSTGGVAPPQAKKPVALVFWRDLVSSVWTLTT